MGGGSSEEDIESLPRKKRRLRLDLITSKLSKPYASPATHISTQRTVRKGIWARQRLPGRILLRKAAILNSVIRQRRIATEKPEESYVGLAVPQITYDLSSLIQQRDLANRSRRHSFASPRASVGIKVRPPDLSNYDVFDHEDDPVENENDETESLVYSDFNELGSETSDGDDDEEYSFGSFETRAGMTADEGVKAIGLVLEIERKEEVSVAPTRL